MCGIIAIVGKDVEKKYSATMPAIITALSKRGPDECATLPLPNVVFGHTRLSIIDLAGGHQPMTDMRTGNIITFNGEIFNYRELKEDLKKKGYRFETNSDTEVILKMYSEYGENCVNGLDGQFAFAIFDKKDESLFIARDRFGEKPLYYALNHDSIMVASEIKAIIASGYIKPKLDLTSLDNYLTLLYVPPWRSVYENIVPLMPAYIGRFKNGQLTTHRYWKLIRSPLSISVDEAIKKTRDLVFESVKSRMVADVEVGSFLSGGIDSSIVTSLAQKTLNETDAGRKIKAFSARFEGFIDETTQAKETAIHCGADYRVRDIQTDSLSAFSETINYFDEPFGDSSALPMRLISRFAQKEVKVTLSGDGGDELFWGYGHYRKHWNLQKHKRFFVSLFSNPFSYYKKRLVYFSTDERRKLWKDPSVIEKDPLSRIDLSEAKTHLEKINLIDFYANLPGDMLVKVDRASMSESLEVRSPFLNHKLAQFAYNLPAKYKTNKRYGKLILEKAFSDILPPGLFRRKKQGFNAPVSDWLLETEWKNRVFSALSDTTVLAELMDMKYARSFAERFYTGEINLHQKVWILLCLSEWMTNHKRKK